jgi:hypothetical protein
LPGSWSRAAGPSGRWPYILAREYVALIDFFRRAVKLAGRGRVPVQVPPAAAGDGRCVRGGLADHQASAAPGRRQLGYEPVALNDGLTRMVAWLQASGRLGLGRRSHQFASESTA